MSLLLPYRVYPRLYLSLFTSCIAPSLLPLIFSTFLSTDVYIAFFCFVLLFSRNFSPVNVRNSFFHSKKKVARSFRVVYFLKFILFVEKCIFSDQFTQRLISRGKSSVEFQFLKVTRHFFDALGTSFRKSLNSRTLYAVKYEFPLLTYVPST